MRNIKILGLVLVAASAMSAVAASSALGLSEWETRGGVPAGFPVEIAAGVGKVVPFFESTGKEKITCEKSKTKVGSAAITGKFEAHAVVEYQGHCKVEGPKLNAACAEPITTTELKIQPGDRIGGGAPGTEPGYLITAKRGGALAEVRCGLVTIKVTGSLVCENPKPEIWVKKAEVVCAQAAAGVQKFKKIEAVVAGLKGGLELTATAPFGGTEEEAQNTTEEVEFAGGKEVLQTA